tara:strand:- start:451 stop:639 length:189 start_codon:yes stop_codon:yes gene_type:complete
MKLKCQHLLLTKEKNKIMGKKKKLNSKNPKYWDKSVLNEKPIKKKILMCEPKGIKIYAVWYD